MSKEGAGEFQEEAEGTWSENLEENITFVHPRFLPNTKFIKTRPKPIKYFVTKRVNIFKSHHDFTNESISYHFYNEHDKISYLLEKGSYFFINSAQEVIDDLFYFDLHSSNENGTNRCFVNKAPPNIMVKFINTFELFCARHLISSSQGSSYLFGNPTLIRWLKNKESTLRSTTFDEAMLNMHRIDVAHVNKMGKVYENWI